VHNSDNCWQVFLPSDRDYGTANTQSALNQCRRPHFPMKRFGQEHVVDIGAFAIEAKVKDEATVRLHAEDILKVIAGESSDVSDATEARVVVNKYVILRVGPESKANVVNAVF
jgi:hypothetical protein